MIVFEERNDMKRKKVAIIFIYLQNNLGDDLFLQHICLRYPNTDFYVMENNLANKTFDELDNLYFSKEMRRYFKEFDLPEVSKGAKKFYSEFDACVVLGGSIFMQHNQQWQGKLKNFNRRTQVNKHTYVLGANFGPFYDPNFLTEHTAVFEKINDICFRDSFSASFFPDATNVRYAPDILFSYKHKIPEQKNQVCISLINGFFEGRPVNQAELLKAAHKDYTNKIVEICVELNKRGTAISLLSFCKYQGDDRIAEIVEEQCLQNGITNVTVCSYDGDANEILDEIASSKAVIATRFHAMILGFLFGKAVYPIIYDEKQRNVIQDLNFFGESCPIEKAGEIDAKAVVDCLLDPRSKNAYEAVRPTIEKAIVDSEQQFAALDELLRSNGE